MNPMMDTMMKHPYKVVLGALALTIALNAPAFSQGEPQTIALMKIEAATLATGYRTSKVVGSTVINELNENVGTIDDLIVTANDKVPFAVLSVGGFLGVGTKLVVVSFSELQVRDKQMLLRGATKESLKGLPNFIYAN
jgi:hypothetical protein